MERRRHERIAQKPVSGITVAFSGDAKGIGTLYDLSPGGCKVGCTNPPPLGASLRLQLDVSQNADSVKTDAGIIGWTIKGKFFGKRLDLSAQIGGDSYVLYGKDGGSAFDDRGSGVPFLPRRSASSASRISAGRGGHPGMRTSTGMCRSTGPVTA